MNLNWDFNMGEKTDLSTVAYASWGRGGGTGPRGNGRIRGEDPDGDGPLSGQIDYTATEANNALVGVGGDYGAENGAGYIRRASVNNHQWYGLITNLTHQITEDLSVNVGVDGRMYTGEHFRQVSDLYGLSGWSNDRPDGAIVTNTYDSNPWASVFNSADACNVGGVVDIAVIFYISLHLPVDCFKSGCILLDAEGITNLLFHKEFHIFQQLDQFPEFHDVPWDINI